MGIDFRAFLGVAIILIITPGPDVAPTMRNAFTGSRRAGVFTALGVGTGMAIWTIATSAGLATILLASEAIYFALKLLGAGYLTFHGIQASFAALLVLGLLMSVMTCAWLSIYSSVIAKTGDYLRLPRVCRSLDGIMGIALVAPGLRLATASRWVTNPLGSVSDCCCTSRVLS